MRYRPRTPEPDGFLWARSGTGAPHPYETVKFKGTRPVPQTKQKNNLLYLVQKIRKNEGEGVGRERERERERDKRLTLRTDSGVRRGR